MQLYPCQTTTVEHVLARVQAGYRHTLVFGPTGIGKSVVILECRRQLPGNWLIVTPRIEIVRGFLQKLGHRADYNESTLRQVGESQRIYTPIRLRNLMLAGQFPFVPDGILWDEGHHSLADSWQQIALMIDVPQVAFTASPYRGTPKQTYEFREIWGEPFIMISYPGAVEAGYLSRPECRIVPLIDDDVVTTTNGEFVTSSLESATLSRLDDAMGLFNELNKPTVVSVPSTAIARELGRRLGIRANVVLQDTSFDDRREAFANCLASQTFLVQIDVVSEGVDLPIRRLIDLKPTLSPVRWVQQIGRIMRPGGESEYVCTNRNLLRHAYLLEGMIPTGALVEATKAFPPSARAGARAIGLEAIGKLKPVDVPLSNGLTLTVYTVSRVAENTIERYTVLLHPNMSAPLIAKATHVKEGETIKWGKWVRATMPKEFVGFQSVPAGRAVSEKQMAWWKRSAAQFGLDSAVDPTAKQFQVLPVLSDLRMRVI